MATYAVGDVQGCFETLGRLLSRCGFREGTDRLWLTGDLVNRGPRSLDVLRWARRTRGLLTVLGNHDLHLLARAEGVAAARAGDTLDGVLSAPDREELLSWLRQRPFAHREGRTLLVHAGLLARWTAEDALRLAREASETLLAQGVSGLLAREAPASHAARVLTRLRACDRSGEPLWKHKVAPAELPRGAVPWFDVAGRRSRDVTIVFGHWGRLGLHVRESLLGVDTGCVWGGLLTAVRLEDRAVFQERVAPGEKASPRGE